MTSLDLAFTACGLLAVVAGVLAVTTRQVVHAALWLVVALLGVAGAVLVLGHELVALVLILVYVGAIVVLVLFALMLTRAPIGPDLTHDVPWWRSVLAALAGAATTALLLTALLPLAGDAVQRREVVNAAIATEIFGTWVWPFEALSVLLLSALIAALAVSRGRPAPLDSPKASRFAEASANRESNDEASASAGDGS